MHALDFVNICEFPGIILKLNLSEILIKILQILQEVLLGLAFLIWEFRRAKKLLGELVRGEILKC